MIFNAWHKFDELALAIKCLIGALLLSTVIILVLIFSLTHERNALRLYIPPNLVAQGGFVKPEDINETTVYAFTFQIFSSINTWMDSGERDYKQNLSAYKNYLSSKFYQTLLEDYRERLANGELNRVRVVGGDPNHPWTRSNVQALGNGVWHVDLYVEVQETVSGTAVKEVELCYPLIVQKANVSIQTNPWGLVIAGFYQSPYRVKTIEK